MYFHSRPNPAATPWQQCWDYGSFLDYPGPLHPCDGLESEILHSGLGLGPLHLLECKVEATSQWNLVCKNIIISETYENMNMEANVCKHFQTGYCKFGSKGCRKQHVGEICSTPKCSSKSCNKKHPKSCKYFSFQQICKFGDRCLYKHSISSNNSNIDVLIQEVKLLKATIVILGDKVRDLENEIVTINQNQETTL